MRMNLAGQQAEVTPSKMLELMTAAWRLDVARHLKRIRDVPGPAAAKLRAELEYELQVTDELANQARVPA